MPKSARPALSRPASGLISGLALVLAAETAAFAASVDSVDQPQAPGMFGGGLISALFLGEPFTGPRLADIAIIGLVVFALFRLLAGRRSTPAGPDRSALPKPPAAKTASRPTPETDTPPPPPGPAPGTRDAPTHPAPGMPSRTSGPAEREPSLERVYQAAEAAWGGLRSTPSTAPAAPGATRPVFQNDDEEFLAGAKAAYARIREAMEKGNPAEAAAFVAPDFLKELGRLAKERFGGQAGPPSRLLLIEAGIVDRRTQGNVTRVDTLYEVLAKRDGQTGDDREREIWTFERDESRPGAVWLLTAIRPDA